MDVATSPLSTALLVDRCIGGEEEAARQLFRQEQARVHAVLFRLLGSNHEIDDLSNIIRLHMADIEPLT